MELVIAFIIGLVSFGLAVRAHNGKIRAYQERCARLSQELHSEFLDRLALKTDLANIEGFIREQLTSLGIEYPHDEGEILLRKFVTALTEKYKKENESLRQTPCTK